MKGSLSLFAAHYSLTYNVNYTACFMDGLATLAQTQRAWLSPAVSDTVFTLGRSSSMESTWLMHLGVTGAT